MRQGCKMFFKYLAEKKIEVLLAILLIILTSFSVSYALFAGGHTVFPDTTSPEYDRIEFCVRCHPDVVDTVMVSEHNNSGCICHGYNPNASSNYTVNVKHNLTKDIYCTNCHSNFNETGNITIQNNLSGLNQSGHYIIGGNTILYNHSREFFN